MAAMRPPVQVQPRKVAAPKTSAYLNKCRATNQNARFWGELTKMAEKAGKIDNIDTRMNRP